MKSLIYTAIAAGLLAISTTATAGEITGNGKKLTLHANSACAFSGFNDTPDGLSLPIGPNGALVVVDPGGRTQSYGSFLSDGFLASPSDPSGRDALGGFPGESCNPSGDD